MDVLEGITVLDFTSGMAGCLATMVLSDFGAEVIKVEPPGGEPFRDWPGAVQWNRGKKSVVLDLKAPREGEQARRLAERSDIVVENFRPGVAERLGVGYEALKAGHEDLVYCSLTGFGPRGPYAHYKGYEAAVSAKCGRLMTFRGQHRADEPHYEVVQTASYSAAMAIVRGVTAALYVRSRTGHGQRVETSLLQTITPYDHSDWLMWQMMIKDPDGYPYDPWASRGPFPAGYLAARTKDGRWIQLANIVDRLFHSMVHHLGMDYIYEDTRLSAAPVLLDEDRDLLQGLMLGRVRERTLDEWMDVFVNRTADVAAEPFMTSQEGMDHPQVIYNGHVCDVEDPSLGTTRQLGPLVAMSDTAGHPRGPAPTPGQHTDEILRDADGTPPARGRPSRALPGRPLEGVTVLDLGTVIAGPLGCSMVGELGARVIHVESPTGEYHRRVRYGLAVNRTLAGAEGLCVDLKTTEGQEIVHKLVARADILLHSMRPGAPERTGVEYERLSSINPRLVYVYAAGYGSSGPHSHRPSMHPIPGAVCGGVVTQMGRDGLPPPHQELSLDEIRDLSISLMKANDGSTDMNSSMALSAAMVMGLYARERTGRGQYIESSMLGANAYANADDFYSHEGKPPRRMPDPKGYGLDALYRLYRASDGWVFLACPFDDEWQALCEAVGRPDLLSDPRFADRESRLANDEALSQELGAVLAGRDALEWEALLTSVDVACVKVEDRGMFHFHDEDEHIRANGFTTEVEHGRWGRFWRYSPLVRFSGMEGKAGPGILKGQHTRPILSDLGYDDGAIADLRTNGIVDWDTP